MDRRAFIAGAASIAAMPNEALASVAPVSAERQALLIAQVIKHMLNELSDEIDEAMENWLLYGEFPPALGDSTPPADGV